MLQREEQQRKSLCCNRFIVSRCLLLLLLSLLLLVFIDFEVVRTCQRVRDAPLANAAPCVTHLLGLKLPGLRLLMLNDLQGPFPSQGETYGEAQESVLKPAFVNQIETASLDIEPSQSIVEGFLHLFHHSKEASVAQPHHPTQSTPPWASPPGNTSDNRVLALP